MKKGKKRKPKEKREGSQQYPQITFSNHVLQQLSRRFNIDAVDVKRMKRVTQSNAFKYPVLEKKYRTGIHLDTTYLVSAAHNLALAVVDNIAVTVLYLDGRNGYSY
jgi:hypothetical protein